MRYDSQSERENRQETGNVLHEGNLSLGFPQGYCTLVGQQLSREQESTLLAKMRHGVAQRRTGNLNQPVERRSDLQDQEDRACYCERAQE
jgi:hypothetical protein